MGQFDRGRLARRLRSDATSAVAANTQNMPAPKTLRVQGAVRMNSSNPRNAPTIASQIASTGGRLLSGNAIHRAASIHRVIGPLYPDGPTYMAHRGQWRNTPSDAPGDSQIKLTPVSQPEGAQGIEATPASGAVAARWTPLLATEASASPTCPCERRARRARVKLVGRLLPLGVSTRCEATQPSTKIEPPRPLRASSRRSDPRGAAHAPRGPRTIGAGAMWRPRAALPRTTVRHERPARHAQPSGHGRAHDRG